MEKRRAIFLQSGGGRGSVNDAGGPWDPRTHVIYPFAHFTNFNRHVGGEYLERLACDSCGEVDEGNLSGYYCAYIIFHSSKEVELNCGCNKKARIMPIHSDQKHGFHYPVEFPSKFKRSTEHIVCWSVAGNKYHLRKFLGKPFTVKELKETHPDFGVGGGACTEYRYSYNHDTVTIERDEKRGEVKIKLTRAQIAKYIDEILFEIWTQENKPAEIDYTTMSVRESFLNAIEGKLPARKQFFEYCYREIQDTLFNNPERTINQRTVTLLMENYILETHDDAVRYESSFKNLCAQAADNWNEGVEKQIQNNQMNLFFTI